MLNGSLNTAFSGHCKTSRRFIDSSSTEDVSRSGHICDVSRRMEDIICLGCLKLTKYQTRRCQHFINFQICHVVSYPPPIPPTGAETGQRQNDEFSQNEMRKVKQIYFNFSFVIIFIYNSSSSRRGIILTSSIRAAFYRVLCPVGALFQIN